MLRRQNELPEKHTKQEIQAALKLFQEWFGILEFPQTFAQEAERFATMKLSKDSNLPMAA
jgi:hypothetical protein